MVNATPDIACFVGSPYIGADGQWHCQGDTVAPASPLQLRKMNLPPFIKMSLTSPPIKIDDAPTATVFPPAYRNCLRRQAPPNYTYLYNPANGNCMLVALADVPRVQAQIDNQTLGGGSTAGSGAGGDVLGSVRDLVSQHPVLAIGALVGVVYMFANKGMKPKSREVVSTTRY